jgi:hypothetical protein
MTKIPAILIAAGATTATLIATYIERSYSPGAAVMVLFGYVGVGLMVCGFFGYPFKEEKEEKGGVE